MADYYKVKANGKDVQVPKADIEKYVNCLQCSIDEGIKEWLYDNDFLVNAEEKALTEKLKGSRRGNARAEKKADAPKKKANTHKISDEKKALFDTIVNVLSGYDFKIEKENKLLIVNVNDKIFKVDLVETRPPKK